MSKYKQTNLYRAIREDNPNFKFFWNVVTINKKTSSFYCLGCIVYAEVINNPGNYELFYQSNGQSALSAGGLHEIEQLMLNLHNQYIKQ